MGFIVLLMLIPFEALAYFDRSRLRALLEQTLGRAGHVTRVS
jgi:hypothetical protein